MSDSIFTKAFKQKWIDALESGRYKWGKGRMYNPRTKCHCAIGVAAAELGYHFTPGGCNIKEFSDTYFPDGNNGWFPLYAMGIPRGIWPLNDNSKTQSYREAIEAIKAAPAVDE